MFRTAALLIVAALGSLWRWLSIDSWTRFLASLSYAAFCVPLLGMGPLLQHYFFGLLNSNATSIYESIYDNGICCEYSSLSNWFTFGLQMPYIGMAMAIALYSLRDSSARRIFFRTAGSAFVVLFLYDIWSGLISNGLTVQYIFENFTADLMGSFILAAIAGAAFTVGSFFFDHVTGGTALRRGLASGSLVVVSIFVTAFVFYVSRLFLDTREVSVDFSLSTPASGNFSIVREDSAELETAKEMVATRNDAPTTSLLPQIESSASASWTALQSSIHTTWNTIGSNATFDISIAFTQGCPTAMEAIEASKTATWSVYRQPHSLEYWADEGPTRMDVNPDGSAIGEYRVAVDTAAYWIDKNGDEESLKITHFTDKSSEVSFSLRQGDILATTQMTFLRDDKLDGTPVPRSFTVNVDGNQIVQNFLAPRLTPEDAHRQLTCRPLNMPLGSNAPYPTGSLVVTAVIRITEQWLNTEAWVSKDGGLTARGGSGWLSVDKIPYAALEGRSVQPLKMLNVHGNVRSIRVGGEEFVLRETDILTAIGALRGKYRAGRLDVSGTADQLWKGQDRLSPTRWETMDWTARTIFLGWLLGIFMPIGRFFFNSFRRDFRYSWL